MGKSRLLGDAEVPRKGQAVPLLLPHSQCHPEDSLCLKSCFILSERNTWDPAGFNIFNEPLDNSNDHLHREH